MRKLGMIVTLIIAALVVAACGGTPAPTATPQPVEDAPPNIGLAIGLGDVEDGGFNQLSLAGVSAVSRRLGAEFEYEIAGEEPDVVIPEMAASGDFDIIVTVGFQLGDATLAAAQEYPDIHFVGIDQFQVEPLENLTGVIFAEDQAGYLAGVLAANLTETGTISGVYGPESVGPVRAFASGYENGALATNEDLDVITTFYDGDESDPFSDIQWGADTATAQLEAGSDVVFTAAGDTGRGALINVAQQVENIEGPLYCIGVDTDQWQTATQARPCLVSSAVKNIPEAVDEVITQVLAGSPPVGNFFGPVGLAPFHDFDDMISDELRGELERIAVDLTSGALETGYEG